MSITSKATEMWNGKRPARKGRPMTTTETTTQTSAPTPPDEPEPVDQLPDRKPSAFTRITAHREGTKQPIFVDWLRNADERTALLRWAVGYGLHVVLHHLVRLPLYQGKLTGLAPLGGYRVVRSVVRPDRCGVASAAPRRGHPRGQQGSGYSCARSATPPSNAGPSSPASWRCP